MRTIKCLLYFAVAMAEWCVHMIGMICLGVFSLSEVLLGGADNVLYKWREKLDPGKAMIFGKPKP